MGNLLYLNIFKGEARLLHYCVIAGERDLNDILNTVRKELDGYQNR